MARDDSRTPFDRGPVARQTVDFEPLYQGNAAAEQRAQQGIDRTFEERRQILSAPAPGAEDETPYDIGLDPTSGEIHTSAGVFEGTPSNIMAVRAAIKAGKLAPAGKISPGLRGTSFDEYLANVDATERESSVFRSAGAGFLGGLGAISEFGDLMVGTDEPDSWFSDQAQNLREGASLGQQLAKEDSPLSSTAALGSNLGEFAGNIASNLIGAAPAAVAGYAGANVPGAVALGGLAVTGGASTAGDAGKAAYTQTMEGLNKLPDEDVQAMPEYLEVRASMSPDATHEDIKRGMATEAARTAMAYGFGLGAGEAVAGAKVGAGILRKLGMGKIFGMSDDAAKAATSDVIEGATPLSRPRRIAGAVGRGAAAATGGSAIEVSQTAIPAAAAARESGIGSTDPLDYVSMEEVKAVAPGEFLLGMFGGGGGRASTPQGEAADAIAAQAKIDAATDPMNVAKGSDIGAALAVSPEIGPEHTTGAGTPSRADFLENIPSRSPLQARRQEIGDAAMAIEAANAPFQGDTIPAGQRMAAPQPAPEEPLQQAPFGPEPGMATPPGPAREIPPNLQERAAYRQMQQQAPAQQAVAPGGGQAALPAPPGPPTADVDAQTQQLLQQRDEIEAALDQVQQFKAGMPLRDPRRRQQNQKIAALSTELTNLDAQLDALDQQWQAAQEAAQPAAAPAIEEASPEALTLPSNQLNVPPPAGAPQDLAPEGGRPIGVAPAPTPNPVPMSPEEAASRAQTAGERGSPIAPSEVPGAQPAPAGEPTTMPEPEEDIAAQIAAMQDPASGRKAVFIAEDPDGAPGRLPAGVDLEGITIAHKAGVGTILTTDPATAQQFRRLRKGADVGPLLGISTPKAAVVAESVAAGKPPTVVQAVTPTGAVAAEEVAAPTPGGKTRAAIAVSKSAGPKAAVVETTVDAALKRRQAAKKETPAPKKAPAKKAAAKPAPKAEAAKKTSKEKATAPKKKPAKKAKADEEVAAAPKPAPAPSKKLVAKPQPSVELKTPAAPKYTMTVGQEGKAVDLRVVGLRPNEGKRLSAAANDDSKSKKQQEQAESDFADWRDVRKQLDADTTAAEQRLESSLDTADKVRYDIATAQQLSIENEDHPTGRKRAKPHISPLLYFQLTKAEVRGFLHAMRAEAQNEVGSYNPTTSMARTLYEQIAPAARNVMSDPVKGRRVISDLAKMSDAELEADMPAVWQRISDNIIAKQAMRGATQVNHALYQAKSEGQAQVEALDVYDKGPQVDTSPTLPKEAGQVVRGWAQHFERGGNKFSKSIRAMSLAEARARYPEANIRNQEAVFYRARNEHGVVDHYVIAVDANKYGDQPAAMLEALGHEFSHILTEEMYLRADSRTQHMLRRTFDAWLRLQQGRSPHQIISSEMTPLLRQSLDFNNVSDAYARKFHEWSARNLALYLMDPQREAHSVVEKFWSKAADVLRAVWSRITGQPKPNEVWAEVADRWIRGTLDIEPDMPAHHVPFPNASMELQMSDLEDLTQGEENPLDKYNFPGSEKVATRMLDNATRGLDGIKAMFRGEKTAASTAITKSKLASDFKRTGLKFMTRRDMVRYVQQINEVAGTHLKSYENIANNIATLAKKTLQASARWIDRAEKLIPQQKAALQRIMMEATTYGIHPDAPFDASKETDPERRKDTRNAHLLSDTERVTDENARRYKALRELWDDAGRANPDIQKIYTNIRDAHAHVAELSYAELGESINNSKMTAAQKQEAQKVVDDDKARRTVGPYFPKKRFGEFIVTAKLPASLIGKDGVKNGEFFDSKSAAQKEATDQKSLNPGAEVSVEAIPDEPGKFAVRVYHRAVAFYKSEAEANSEKARKELLDAVRDHYNNADVDFDEVVKQESESDPIVSKARLMRRDYNETKQMGTEAHKRVTQMIDNGEIPAELAEQFRVMLFEGLPENSYRKQLLPRQNIVGASDQMIRSSAIGLTGASNMYARIKYGKQQREAWEAASEAAKGDADVQRVLDELKKNEQLTAEQESEPNKAGALMSQITSMYSLAFSVPYVLTNAAQPWMVSVPVLGSLTNSVTGEAVGMKKAASVMKQSYEDTIGFFGKRAMQDFVAEWKELTKQPGNELTEEDFAQTLVDRFGKNDPIMKFTIERMYNSGLLDYTFISAMSDAAKGSGAGMLTNVQRLGMAFAAQVEAMNRLVTAKAAATLAVDEHLVPDVTDANAVAEFATDIVAQTQGDYSRANRASVFNTPYVGRALQFKQYVQMMYALFVHNFMLAMKGKTKAEKKQGLRAMRNLLITHGAMGGMFGMGPVSLMAKALVVMIAMASPDDDDDWKTGEELLRGYAEDMFGDRGALIAERGLSAAFGLDAADRFAFPDLVDTRFLGVREGDKPSSVADKLLAYGMGAPWSTAKRVMDGAGALAQGKVWDATSALPSAVRPMAKALRQYTEGVVEKDGDTFIKPGDLNWGDLGATALGLQSAKVAQAYRERGEEKGTKARIETAKQSVLQDARNGKITWAKVQEFNKTVPSEFRISMKQLQAAKKGKRERESGKTNRQEKQIREMLGR